MGKRSYTWEEIKNFLIKELKKTKHIMTYGTIGSCNIEHDIDTIITKKPNSSSVEFYKEIHKLFDSLDNYLNKKYNSKLICFSTAAEQFFALEMAKYSKKDLAFHVMIYVSFPQIEKDWSWALFENDNIKEILAKNYDCLRGSVKDLFSKKFMKSTHCDSLFTFLYMYDKINSHYSEKFLIKIMDHYYDYLFRKRLKLKPPVIRNKKDIKKAFYKLLGILDKLNKENA